MDYFKIKRLIDVTISTLGLIILSPVFMFANSNTFSFVNCLFPVTVIVCILKVGDLNKYPLNAINTINIKNITNAFFFLFLLIHFC